MSDADKTPDPIDIHVGGRVRLVRKTRGVSQEILAQGIGVTFQQVQKYERGSNRISASMIQRIADFFQVPVGDFFPQRDNRTSIDLSAFQDFASHPDSYRVMLGFSRLPPRAKKGVVALVESLTPLPEPEVLEAEVREPVVA